MTEKVSGDGWDVYVKPKKPKEEAAKPAPPANSPDGTMELPGSPRPKVPGPTSENPNPKASAAAAASDAEFRRQKPRGVEEDAEVWESNKGWTTPSGRKENLAPGADGRIDTTPDAPVAPEIQEQLAGKVEADEDTEVIVAPKRKQAPEPAPAMRPRTAGAMGAAKAGVDGRDFQEYQRPSTPAPTMVGGVAPQHASGSFGSLVGNTAASGQAPPPGEPPRLYGQSSVPAPPAAPRPSGKTVIADAGAGLHVPHTPHPHAAPGAPVPPSQVHAAALPKGGPLNVLLVGSGAREHAMALAIRRSQRAHLFVVMKHRNPGLAKSATGFKILDDRDAAGIVAWARQQKIHLAVVGPETPLEAGVTDALRAAGIAVASPSQAAARIETDKSFMRDLMGRHRLPGQIRAHPSRTEAEAIEFLDQHGPEWAIKPVGLTGGKGVQVFGDHFTDLEGAKAYVRSVFAGRVGGGALQFEEVAHGEEFTLMGFTDGAHLATMPAVQDHKRLLEDDRGPNTGGMGSYSQADGLLPFLRREDYDAAARILQGIVDALRADGTPYVGAIYGQFMLTAAGPKVIEVNARLGDPEAMNVLALLESDYLAILEGMATGTLRGQEVRFAPAATVVKYVVPRGYGQGEPAAGRFVQVDDFNIRRSGGMVFLGSIEQHMSGPLVTMASRTLAVLGHGPTIEAANAVCEASLQHVHGDALYVRHDIGSPQLLAKRVQHMQAVRGTLAV